MALHPPWVGNQSFNEYCVSDPNRVKITHVEGFVNVNPPLYRIVNVGQNQFLDSHGKSVKLWGDGVYIGNHPDNITWQLRPVAGSTNTYYIINTGHKKYLDTHGEAVWLWGDSTTGYLGNHPDNIQWTLKSVGPEKPDTYYIVNVGHQTFLDGNTLPDKSVKVWGDGKYLGNRPKFIQWTLRRV